ncbi:hypothetical protein F0562_033316 [Nyssa sinensis]|uniref:DUF220 domain-containing protein n=1 Tax=Nyssa sinensis TaxID=561372 RepID=A0A5J5AVW0_9ASTE|nr:hypothetical protein F0562_033316 [Nyssa sinensis]
MRIQHTILSVISFLCLFIHLPHSTGAAPIGICYGRVANNHPPPSDVANLLKSNGITRIRLFNVDPNTLRAFSGEGITLMIGVPNEVLPSLASGTVNFSLEWLQSNIFSNIAADQIQYIAVGNEVFLKDPFYTPFLLPTILNLFQALQTLGLAETVKLSSPHAASILSTSYPPSAGTFDPYLRSVIVPLLQFFHDRGSPLMVNVYPFLSYTNNPNDISLDYALFRSTNVEHDQNLAYNNLFDETIDAFVYAMEREGFVGIPVVASETGWPTTGGEVANSENALAYNGNVVKRALSDVGTPKRPGVGVEVFLFDLFDENEKIICQSRATIAHSKFRRRKIPTSQNLDISFWENFKWCEYSLDSMGDKKVITTSINIQKNESNEHSDMTSPVLPSLFVQLPEKLQKCLKSVLKRSTKDDGTSTAISILRKDKTLSPALEVNLDKQLQAWKENPIWADQSPEIKVSVPKGSLCSLNLNVNVGLPPDAVYNIVTDPDNKRVFKNIKEVISRKVLVDEGSRQVVELDQAALWRFLWWSGTFSVHVLVDQNREDHTMKFKQVKTGFMKKFEGCWKVEPLFVDDKSCSPFEPKTWEGYYSCTGGKGRIGSKVSLEQLIQPALVPPPPFSWYLRGITTRTTETLINDLLAEAARIRGVYDSENSNKDLGMSQGISDKDDVDKLCDIKERWALRRRNVKRCHRRLPLNMGLSSSF